MIGIEPIVIWRDRDKAQEQVFIDQAMHVPEAAGRNSVGRKGQARPCGRGHAFFPKCHRQPRISGAIHRGLPATRRRYSPHFDPGLHQHSRTNGRDEVRVPMLFEYRGEIVPSFPLQAIMLWLRAVPSDVKIELGSKIILPNGWIIPIHRDGTITINPVARQSVRRITLNELLLAAQEHESHRTPSINLDNLKDQIVLLRIADDPLQPPNLFSTAIATIQNNVYIRPAHRATPWLIILAAAIFSCFLWMFSRPSILLLALIFGAGYTLLVPRHAFPVSPLVANFSPDRADVVSRHR